MKSNILFNLVIFLTLIILVASQINWVYFNDKTNYATYKANRVAKTQTVAVDFTNTIPYYVKVTLTPDNGINTPILCFSPTISTCSYDRQIIETRTDGKSIVVFIKREQFLDNNSELYIFVTCEEQKCDYTLEFVGMQRPEIKVNSVFSYVVTNYNKEMIFDVVGEAEEGSFLTIGVEGSSAAKLIIESEEDDLKPISFDNGCIITFPLKNHDSNILSTFAVKVNGNIGDYLTISTHIVNNFGETPDNLLYPNGPAIMGMLLHKKSGYFREECFPISAFESSKFKDVNKYYLTAKFYSKYGLFWLADENGFYMEETEHEISDGLHEFLIEPHGKKRYICIEPSYEEDVIQDNVIYSLSILEPTKLETFYNFYPPQTIGQVYRRMIPKGSYAVYHGGFIEKNAKKITFNMYNKKGFAEMYVTQCTDYPYCHYYLDEFERMEKPKSINKMTIWETKIDEEIEALSKNKYVMIVYCKDDDNENKGYCVVDTSVNTILNTINLVENEEFSKYALKRDKGYFKMDLKEKKIDRVFVEILIYSGNVDFIAKDIEARIIDINYDKHILLNKIIYHFYLNKLILDNIQLEYSANSNSFFTIKYGTGNNDIVPFDKSYLVEIDSTSKQKYKNIYLENSIAKKDQPSLVNFFAYNCQFQIIRDNNIISFFNDYAQEIIYKDSQESDTNLYKYKIEINDDSFYYNNKMCMLYVSGYQPQISDYETEIVVPDGIKQKFNFDTDFKSIRFLYPNADPDKNLILMINNIDKADYLVKISGNNRNFFKEFELTNNKIITYISKDSGYLVCERDSLCNVIVEINYISDSETIDKPKIEFLIGQIDDDE